MVMKMDSFVRKNNLCTQIYTHTASVLLFVSGCRFHGYVGKRCVISKV